MKDRFLPYLRLQARRAAHFLPFALFIGLLLLGAVVALAIAAGNAHANEDGNVQLEIGVVGDVKEPYFDAMLYAINHLDGSQIALKMTRMDEATAKRRLNAGEISSYVLIPEGFEERLLTADPLQLTYVLSPTSTGVSTALADDIIRSVTPVLMEGQNTMIGLRQYARANVPGVSIRDLNNDATEQFVRLIFGRSELFKTEVTGIVAKQGFVPYLFFALTTFFILIWGVSCAPLFSGKNTESKKMLSAAGLGAFRQIASEYIAYFALILAGILSASLIIGVSLSAFAPELFRSLFTDGEDVFRFLWRVTAVTAVFAALQFMLYELARNTVAAILLQTFSAVFLGYVSGCFYSSDFFPRALQRFSAFLPAGAAIRYLAGPEPLFGLVLAGYFILFISVILIKRRADLARDAA